MIKGQTREILENLFSMKTKTIESGKTKIWFDREEEFTIVGKNESLIDTLIMLKYLLKSTPKSCLKKS